MYIFFISLIIGIVQGITEFAPISSSGHTLILYKFLAVPKSIDIITLQIVVHFGTLLAIIMYFYRKIASYIQAFFLYPIKKDLGLRNNFFLSWYIIAATIPLGIIGFFFENMIENVVHTTYVVPITLIIGGILFILAEKYSQPRYRTLHELKLKDAVIIGTSQVLALIPGVSRSGITIITGMSRNLNRKLAAEFTFLLAIPTVAGVTVKKLLDFQSRTMQQDEILFYIIAGITSWFVGLIVIKFLLNYLANHSLKYFAYYRFALALLVIILLI